MPKKKYKHSLAILNAESLQSLARELRGPTNTDEKTTEPLSRNPSSAKLLIAPVLFALAAELALKALLYQETNKVPPYQHNLLKLFEKLGENTQEELEVTFEEELGENTRRRLEAISPKPPSRIRYVLHENEDVFKDWRYFFEHSRLLCFTEGLDNAISAITKTYDKRLEKGKK